MSTRDQPTIDVAATRADRVGWAVPGVDLATGQTVTEPAVGSGAGSSADPDTHPTADLDTDADAPRRESPETAAAAATTWRRELAMACQPPGGHVHPVIAALATCVTALDGIREAGVGTLSVRELRMLLLAITHVIAAAVAVKLRVLAAADTAGIADLTGATCTAAFHAHLTRSNRPEATSEVRLAKDLEVRYRLLAEALAAGLVSPEQVKVCITALRRLPKNLSAEKLTACQQALLTAAAQCTPRQLKSLGRQLWEVIDPDGAEAHEGKKLDEEERLARARASFRSWRNNDGTTGFCGKLPDLHADILLKILHAYAAPRRRNNPNIATSQPDDTRRPDSVSGGQPRTCTVHDQPDSSSGCDGCCAPGGHRGHSGQGDGGDSHEPGGHGEGACDGSAADGCLDEASAEEAETGRTIPYPIRLGHALMELLERLPKPLIPDTGGIAATIVVTLREDQLRTGIGTATLDTGTTISAGQARRLACEAGLVPIVLDGSSEPLDVGREQRFHTRAQRLAVSQRQHGTCGIDGCDRPITEYHHPFPWCHGGPTSTTNCVGLCGYHHHLAHHPQWQLLHHNDKWYFARVDRRI